MKRYLVLWLATTVALMLAVALLNVVVDPYGLYRWIDVPGFNAVKPKAGPHGAIVKTYQVLRAQPRTLILGNSRAEVGFDPRHAAWPVDARPVFNMALPGTGPTTSLDHLEHALAAAASGDSPKITMIVWGVDFPDFLTDARTPARAATPRRPNRRLLVNPGGTRNPSRWLQSLRDHAEATLTLGALTDSVQTLSKRSDPNVADLTPLGFNPMGDYVRITADEGYWRTFRQKDIDNTRAYLRRPKDIFDASGRWSADLGDLRRVLDLCRRHGIVLKLVIYPIHAHLLEIIRITDHGPAFDTWKRALVGIVADEAREAQGPSFAFWDFSGFHRYATERIPAEGDLRTKMQWYWEAGHFKRELGDRVLDRVLEVPSADQDFGIRLDASNVESQIAAMHSAERDYRQTVPAEIEALERIAAGLRPRR